MQKLGKYEILAEIGHGAMGVVYKARDPLIGRLVALKTINSNLVDRPDLLERFYQEAQSAGKLQHPNIVTIFELGQEKDTPYIAMEYLDGESLEKAIARQTNLPLALKVGYVVRICQALEYAHKNRVVHRDIKPGNIMVNSEGVVKVVDFGIARLVDFSRTHTNMMIGTPAYMAPELFRKKKADERTDIWAVGVTFYELICYQRPFTGDGYDIIRSIMEDEFPPASSQVPECTPEVESVIQRMLKKPSAERYQSMEDVLLDLEPVWNRLRSEAAAALAERGREFFELGDLPKAQETLRRARQIDNSNIRAKSLLEKVSAELRRIEILPRVQEHLNRGRVFLQSGQFREAQAEAEAALGLDSLYEPARQLVAEVEARAAKVQQLEQKLRLGKQRLAEGALPEAESALRQAFDLDPAHPRVLELKRQIAEEQGRREKRKKLNEVVQRARALWTELKYDDCLVLLDEALKEFPNEPELRKLQENARADQAEHAKQGQISEVRRLLGQQKLPEARKALDALKREHQQDTAIRNLQALVAQEEQEQLRQKRLADGLTNLRSLVGASKLAEAVMQGEQLQRAFPQEYEIKELAAYARGELAQQEQKRNEQEREKQIRELLAAERYREAGEAAKRALREFPKQELFRRLGVEAERKLKELEERQQVQREVQQRILEIRSRITKQELTDAIDLARQTLATLGPDTDVTQLLHAAEVEVAERNKKREEQKRHLETVKTLIEKGDCGAATTLLNEAIATELLHSSDPQAKRLLAQIAEKEEALRKEERERKEEEDRKREEKKRKEAKPAPKPKEKTKAGAPPTEKEAPLPGRGSKGTGATSVLPPPPSPTPTVSSPAAALASSGVRAKPSLPVLTPLPAAQEPLTVETKIRVEERPLEIVAKLPSKSVLKKPAVMAVLGLAAAGVVFAVVHFIPSGRTTAPAEDLALENEAEQFWAQHKLDDSLADWRKLADHEGVLHDAAVKRVAEIEKSRADEGQRYAEAMKLLYETKDYAGAAKKFGEVVQLNLWKVEDAKREYDIASKGPGGAPLPPLWQAFFDKGKQAYEQKDYGTALQNLGQVITANGVPKNIASQATKLIASSQDRQQQKKTFDRAVQMEQSGQKQQAKDEFQRAINAPNGDPDLVASAKTHLQQIAMAPQPNVNPNPLPPSKTQPDYAPVISDVRSMMNQGRWDDADSKLNGLPTTQSEYGDLKRQISAGRQGDQDFTSQRSVLGKAELDKNAGALKASRDFFSRLAGQGGRHSSEANDIVSRIDRDLKEFEAPKPSGGGTPGGSPGGVVASNESAAIKAVLDRYAVAMNNGDLNGVKAVRRLPPNEEKKIGEALKYTRGKGFSLSNCSSPEVNGDSARITCETALTGVKDSARGRTNLTLNRINGQWIIVSTN